MQDVFSCADVPVDVLKIDGICDRARHGAGPTRLMNRFGISALSAARYVLAAHPQKRTGLIAPWYGSGPAREDVKKATSARCCRASRYWAV
ncbi:hypothetical protein [Streptomyces sp. NPDC004291]